MRTKTSLSSTNLTVILSTKVVLMPDNQILMYPVRDYVGSHVYPVHRLDRKTTGVLLFAKSTSGLIHYNKTFEERRTIKTYVSICRGYMPDEGIIDYPLKTDDQANHRKPLPVTG